MSAAQTAAASVRAPALRLQLRRWTQALADGLIQGFAGPALSLAIQAQLPAQAPASPRAQPLKGAST